MKKYIIPELTVVSVGREDIMALSANESGYGMRTTWSDLINGVSDESGL